jgi:hypothetical protein
MAGLLDDLLQNEYFLQAQNKLQGLLSVPQSIQQSNFFGLLGGKNPEVNYAIPALPSTDVMQQAAVPDFKVVPAQSGNASINYAFPNEMRFDPSLGLPLDFVKPHELQHMIEAKTYEKGQLSNPGKAVTDAWTKNAYELGFSPITAEKEFRKNLAKPEVQEYYRSLGADPRTRLMNPLDPKTAPLDELLADVSAWQTKTGQNMYENPVLAKNVFSNSKLQKLIQSTTGMSGFVAGDSDYVPYSLQAAEAWNKQPKKSFFNKLMK